MALYVRKAWWDVNRPWRAEWFISIVILAIRCARVNRGKPTTPLLRSKIGSIEPENFDRCKWRENGCNRNLKILSWFYSSTLEIVERFSRCRFAFNVRRVHQLFELVMLLHLSCDNVYLISSLLFFFYFDISVRRLRLHRIFAMAQQQ